MRVASADRLKKELEQVRSARATQRKDRKRAPVPNAAIVGYTNAGKSSLLRCLTGAEVLVEDKLFATLEYHYAGKIWRCPTSSRSYHARYRWLRSPSYLTQVGRKRSTRPWKNPPLRFSHPRPRCQRPQVTEFYNTTMKSWEELGPAAASSRCWWSPTRSTKWPIPRR